MTVTENGGAWKSSCLIVDGVLEVGDPKLEVGKAMGSHPLTSWYLKIKYLLSNTNFHSTGTVAVVHCRIWREFEIGAETFIKVISCLFVIINFFNQFFNN